MANTATAPARIPTGTAAPKAPTITRVCAGANWFYWIEALSMVNAVIGIFGGKFHHAIGLGMTAFMDVLAKRPAGAGVVVDLIISSWVAGLFFVLGGFANKAERWVFIAGIALYTVDAFLLVVTKDFLSVAFHACALFAISRSLAAAGLLSSAPSEKETMGVPGEGHKEFLG